MTAQGFQDSAGGKAFVDEERQRGHVKRKPLGFAGPVEERFREPGKLTRGIACSVERRSVQNLTNWPLTLLASEILSIPIEGRSKGRVVAVLGRLFAFPELCLRADIRPQGCSFRRM